MNIPWPSISLGEVLTLQRRWLKPEPTTDYIEIGVRSYGRGIFYKAPVSGASLGDKRVLRIEPGDLVFMNVFAWEGAVAVAGRDVVGKIGSHRFATYTPRQNRADVRFLNLYFQTRQGRELLGRISPGSALRNRTMNLADFSNEAIPLPPIEEQRRIVVRIESLAAKISEARALFDAAALDADSICRSLVFKHPVPWPTAAMQDIVRRRPLDVRVQVDELYQFAGVYCFGRGVFRSKKQSGTDFAYRQLTTLRAGDFVYPKLMAWEGALGIVPPECEGCVVSPEFPVFRLDTAKVLPELLDVYFRTPSVWPKLGGASSGTNMRRRRLNPDDFLDHHIPLPPMGEQRRLAAARVKVLALKASQDKSINELNALFPAVLDRAFKGEL